MTVLHEAWQHIVFGIMAVPVYVLTQMNIHVSVQMHIYMASTHYDHATLVDNITKYLVPTFAEVADPAD